MQPWWLTLISLISMMFFNYKATPTSDTNYNRQVKAIELI